MKTRVTYITDDGIEFEDSFSAKRHECEITEHRWEYYNENMGLQKEMNEHTKMKFCKKCQKQESLK